MKNTLLFILLITIFGCNSSEPISNYKKSAEGFLKAKSGDLNITGEIGLIAYNWYAINTSRDKEIVYVTWDDGLTCQTTEAKMYLNKITMKVKNIDCEFTIEDSEYITVKFMTDKNTYTKHLKKERDDPTVLCM